MNLIELLTNENPVLIKLITIIFTVPEVYLFFKLFSLNLSIDDTKRNAFVYVSIMTFGTAISLIAQNSLIKDFLCLISFFIAIKFYLKQNIKTTFVAIVLSYTYALVSEYISTSFLMLVKNITYEHIMNIPLYYSLVLILTLSVMLLIFAIIYFFKKKIKLKPHIKKMPFKVSILFNLILGIVTMAIETYLFTVYIDIIPKKILIIMIGTTFIFFSISMYCLIRTNKLEKTEEDLENAKMYNKTLALLHDNIRGFKHDFNNIVQSIGGYIVLEDIDGLKNYYKKLLEDCKITNNLNLLNPESINNPSIYSLLTNKYYLASGKGINMKFSIFSDLSKITTNIYDISRVLGILLDNAIEAAEETEEKIVDIEIQSDDKKQLFIIKNSCLDTNISTTKIFEKGYSTKNRDSGFGLWNVHKILSKNTNLDLYTSVNNNIFSQQFAIYY